MTHQLEYLLTVLGGFRLEEAAAVIALPLSCRRLVALLAVTGPQSRAQASARLWPDLSQSRAASNLRTVLWRLRRAADGLVATEGDALRLVGVRCDLDAVREWTRRTVLGEQPWPLPEHAGADLLPSWSDEWLIDPREELRLLQLHALEVAAQRFLMAGRLPEACSSALTAVTMDPLRESATRLLIEIHIREGNALDAMRRFRRFRELLDREVGVAPSPAVLALVGSLSSGRPRGSGSVRRVGHRG